MGGCKDVCKDVWKSGTGCTADCRRSRGGGAWGWRRGVSMGLESGGLGVEGAGCAGVRGSRDPARRVGCTPLATAAQSSRTYPTSPPTCPAPSLTHPPPQPHHPPPQPHHPPPQPHHPPPQPHHPLPCAPCPSTCLPSTTSLTNHECHPPPGSSPQWCPRCCRPWRRCSTRTPNSTTPCSNCSR